MMKKLLSLCFISLFGLISSQVFAQSAQILGAFESWQVHKYDSKKSKICFLSAQPKQTLPAGVNRGQIVFYISSWPKQKVSNEISVKIGYPFKTGSKPTVEIGTQKFNLIAKRDKAFIEKTEIQPQLIEAMKKGNSMIVRGVSARGTKTTDTYSLNGISKALQELQKACK